MTNDQKPRSLAIAKASSVNDVDFDRPPLDAALTAAGIAFEWLDWDDPKAKFSSATLTLLRSTWNYIEHREAFVAWAHRFELAW